MKLSDIKGKRALAVAAEAMELADALSGDERVEAMLEDYRKSASDGTEAAWKVMCRHLPPLLRDERYADSIVSLLALANGVPQAEYEESGDLLADIRELLLEDSESLGFLSR